MVGEDSTVGCESVGLSLGLRCNGMWMFLEGWEFVGSFFESRLGEADLFYLYFLSIPLSNIVHESDAN
jgi:hypothetical protein